MSHRHFMTGMYSAADLQRMRETSGKPELLLALGQYLRDQRKRGQVERSSLGLRCGIAPEQLARFEHGLGDIDFVVFDKLCAELGVETASPFVHALGMGDETARQNVDLARSWTAGGNALSVLEILGLSAGRRR